MAQLSRHTDPPFLPSPGDVPTSRVITHHCLKPGSLNNIYPYKTCLSWVWGKLDLSTYEKLKNDSNIMSLKWKELAVFLSVVEIVSLDPSGLLIVRGPLNPPHSCLRRKLVLIVRWVYLRLQCWTAHTCQCSCCRHKHIPRCLGKCPQQNEVIVWSLFPSSLWAHFETCMSDQWVQWRHMATW